MRAIIVRDGKLLLMRRDKFGDEYYTLLGGGIQAGETKEAALRRELLEESGLILTDSRLVFIEKGYDGFGDQFIFLCRTEDGEPRLAESSEEARDSSLGNVYTPVWITASDIAALPLRSAVLSQALARAFTSGFPQEPVILDDRQGVIVSTVQVGGRGDIHDSKT